MEATLQTLNANAVNFIPLTKNKKKKYKRSKLEKHENRTAFAFILPSVLSFCVFVVAPLVMTVVLSFMHYDQLTLNWTWAGFENYADLLCGTSPNSKEFLNSILNTIILLIEVPISIALGLLCASLANSFACKHTNKIYRVLIYLPAVCSAVATNIIWRCFFEYSGKDMMSQAGVINAFFGFDIYWLKNPGTILAAMIIKNSINTMGSAMILYYASMCNISKEYYEAAEIDGANGLQRFWKITFPMLSPVTFYLLIMRISGCLQSYTDSAVFAKGSDMSRTIVYFIYQYGIRSNNYSLAAAASLLLAFVIMGVTVVQFRLSNKWVLDL